MVTDPIADFLTRIRNAQMANHRIVEIPASNLKKRMTEILYDKGYILKYKFEDDSKQGVIKIALKYDAATKLPVIQSLERVSRPGLRTYAKPDEFKRVKNGLGIAIVSTSKGVMTDKEAGDYAALDLLPKNASPVRLKNRCQLTGRPRGYMRHFALSRNMFRDMALEGKIPGVTKASW